MFRTGFLSIIRSLVLYTQQQVYVIQVLLTQNLYDIYLLLCIQYQTPDDGQKTCPKHVEFYSKNKFEKLVHLIGFITRIYHDARFSECQTLLYLVRRLRIKAAVPPLHSRRRAAFHGQAEVNYPIATMCPIYRTDVPQPFRRRIFVYLFNKYIY